MSELKKLMSKQNSNHAHLFDDNAGSSFTRQAGLFDLALMSAGK
jgi:hypothetical protein